MRVLAVIFSLIAFWGCAAAPPLPPADLKLVPLKEANLEMVFEENEGIEVNPADAKEIRDYYRAGVQKKALAEKRLEEKTYPAAMKFFQESCDLLSTVLTHIDEDTVAFPCFEGTNILFFPNLLAADNHLKMGKIQKAMGRENPAQRSWKKALLSVRQSLRSEPKQVKVDYLDGCFMFKYRGIMYSSPRLDAQGVATTPEGQQYIYSKDDRAFSVADGERYFELAKCKESR